jgi:D-xylose 1-dehydrogenase
MRPQARQPAISDLTAQYPSLAGQVVFVSGGSTGLGAEFVVQFARQGARVGFVDVDVANGRRLASRLAEEGWPVPVFVPADVRQIPELEAAISTVAGELGPITVLVNNAASDERHEPQDVTVEYWDDRMAVNLRHHFFAAKAVVAGMTDAGGGSIINLGSISAHANFTGLTAYVTAKAGIEGLTWALAREFARHRVRVNCVIPGWVMTPRQLASQITPEGEHLIDMNQSMPGRLVPSDVAALVLWLAADDSAMVTGQRLPVDGGWV